MTIRDTLKGNLIYIIIIIGMGVCFINRWQLLDTVVAPDDTTVWYDVGAGTASQTWAPNVKWIEHITIPFLAKEQIKGDIKVSFINNKTGQILISQDVYVECNEGEQGELVLDFNHQPLDITSQYMFQLKYGEVQEGNGIYLYGSENYAGGEIGNKDINTGITIKIAFVKYTVLFWLALMLFVLYSFGVFYMLLWNKRFEETVGLGVLSIGTVLYIFGLGNHLEEGIYLVILIALILFVSIIYQFNKNKMRLSQIYCPSMIIFAVIFAGLLIYNRGIWYTRCDEYIHWGTAIKDMFYFNSMSKHPYTTVAALDYPPFATLLEYFFTYWNGLFSEPITYVGYQITMVSLLAVCWKTEKKHSFYIIPLVLATVLVPIMFINDSFCTVYADSLLGAIMAYLMVCWLQEGITGFNVVRLTLGLIALTLTKRYGIFFALLFVGILALDYILEKRKFSKWIWIILFLGTIILSFVSFDRYSKKEIAIDEVKTVSNSSSDIKETQAETTTETFSSKIYNKLVKAEPDAQQKQLWITFLKDMWTENTWELGWYNASYMGVVVTLQMVSAFVWLGLKRKKYKTDILKKSVLLTIGAIGYGAIILVSRIRLYNVYSGTVVDSHERYMGSYGIVMVLFILILLLQNLEKVYAINHSTNFKHSFYIKKAVLALAICCLIIISTPLNFIINKNTGRGFNSEYMYPFDDIEKMTQSTAKIGDRVYYITNNGRGDNKHVFAGTVSPWMRVSIRGNDGMCASESIYKEHIKNHPEMMPNEKIRYVSEDEFADELREYQYVFIMKSEDYFIDSYRGLFEEPDSVENGSFYKVKYNEEGKVCLELIGKVGVLIC